MEKHSSQPHRYKVGHVIRLESHRQNPASNCFASPDKKTKGKHTKCGWRTFWGFAYSKLVLLQDFIIIQSFTQSLNFKYNAHYYSVLIYIVINVTVRENCISAMTQFLVLGMCNPCQPGYTAPLKENQCGLLASVGYFTRVIHFSYDTVFSAGEVQSMSAWVHCTAKRNPVWVISQCGLFYTGDTLQLWHSF